jgi:hypothetical protein
VIINRVTGINNKKLTFLVFIFFLLIYITSNGGHLDGGDGKEWFLVTESMALKHSAMLYPDVPSVQKLHVNVLNTIIVNTFYQTGKAHYALKPMYIAHCCLLSAVGVPFYYLAVVFSASPVTVVAISVNSLILSLISLVIFCFSLEVYGSKKISIILSVIFAVCSFAWPYNTSFFPEPLEALLLISSAFFIYISVRKIDSHTRNIHHKGIYFAALGGLFLGFSVLAHPSSLIVIPGFIIYSVFSINNRKALSTFLVVLAIVLLFAGLVNYWRFGSFTNFGYGPFGQLAEHNGWAGLIGLLAGPGFGLIFYLPITILLPIAFKFMYKQDNRLFFLFAYIIIVHWLFFGTLSFPGIGPATWNGLAWGPRYLLPIIPFITILIGALLPHLKTRLFLKLVTIALCISGFYINLLGELEWYWYGYGYGWSVLGLSKFQMDAKVPGINSIDLITWNPIYSPIALVQESLSSDYVSKLPPNFGLGLAPCPYDSYVFCKFGIMPTLLMLAVITFIGILIITEIDRFNARSLLVYLKNYAKK